MTKNILSKYCMYSHYKIIEHGVLNLKTLFNIMEAPFHFFFYFDVCVV